MKYLFKLLLILFFVPLTLTATNKKGKYTKSIKITKEFNVNASATLNVKNKFGNINIVTWSENRIVIDVTITTNGNDKDKVEKRLKQIRVEFSSSSNYVSAKTIIERSTSSWNLWGKRNNVSMEINYLIKMPITNNVELNNDYGAISIDKLEGTSKINCDYGRITIGELWNSENVINIDYTNNSTIEFMKDGKINTDYSTLHVKRAGRTELNAVYSHVSFGLLVSLNYNCDYGDLKIEDCGNLIGNSDYMHIIVQKLRGKGDFKSDYGSIKINELGEDFKRVDIVSSYTHIKLGINATTSFHITASLNYGSFKYGNGFNFSKEIKKNSSKYYEGYFNSPNSSSNITIKSSYGNVSFTNN